MYAPLVSIIIPVLNGESTLDRCFRSLTKQVFRDYEVIVVDGGSRDRTMSILAGYKSALPQLHLLVCPGLGLYASMNTGIEQARGQWLYFMGCDDQLRDASTLATISNVMTETRAKVVAGSVQYAEQGYVMHPQFGSPYWLQCRLHHQGTFYHRSVFEQFRYNPAWQIAADRELHLRLALAGLSCQVVPEVVALFGERGISSRDPERCFTEIEQIHQQLFHGPVLGWMRLLDFFERNSWLLRRRWGLLNLKVRLRRRLAQALSLLSTL
ncbi:PGL/p-HBAD biosynthesis glycosyltransferase Rv2957/MT3031 [Fibrisoma limi BUZ 3]|uniref:PGL/p-HBAD biosynthesis glycosyltransferase Rv2957/MT3031 n=1 Tax=Fibrisoma limi BUZ 3 TaxID=1185876 RepID=I2GJX1_9BACT|nr:glycosyltransferase [Fibrisoma limi]CCH54196.1 PGL/p-HBAD biosynthesis glycosyltransferase Rv2957/MT3031 [Fibrisoma limi BUZ 3]